jgi:hypothetical protein
MSKKQLDWMDMDVGTKHLGDISSVSRFANAHA